MARSTGPSGQDPTEKPDGTGAFLSGVSAGREGVMPPKNENQNLAKPRWDEPVVLDGQIDGAKWTGPNGKT